MASFSKKSVQTSNGGFAIVPNDTKDLPSLVRRIRCKPISGAAGTLHVMCDDGNEFTTEISVGEKLDIIVRRVYAAGTTATGLEGFA